MIKKLLLIIALCLSCSSANTTSSDIIYGADDSFEDTSEGVSGSIPIGSILKTTTNVNFRKGPSTSYGIIRVLLEDTEVISVNKTSSTNSFYNVKHQGTEGWVHGKYLQIVSTSVVDSGAANSDQSFIIKRAQQSVGFSYWWGHGRWLASGPTSSNKGSCSGSCPSCSHNGSYGADCSGMVAKAWSVPASNDDVSDDQHPYSTASFDNDSSLWYTVLRDNIKPADALVYNSGGSGHIVLYESGDGWGSMWVYECKGCSYGCVHDLRSLSSAYHGIRKK